LLLFGGDRACVGTQSWGTGRLGRSLGRDVEWPVVIIRWSMGGSVVMRVEMLVGARYWGVGDEDCWDASPKGCR
jgi:hypothetical protein